MLRSGIAAVRGQFIVHTLETRKKHVSSRDQTKILKETSSFRNERGAVSAGILTGPNPQILFSRQGTLHRDAEDMGV